MRKLVAAVTALVGLAALVGSLGLLQLPATVPFMGLPFWSAVGAFVLALVPVGASVALAAVLIRDRERIAAWYVPDDDPAPVVPAESLLRVGIVLLGIYLVAQAIPQLLSLLTSPFVNWLQVKFGTVYSDAGVFADEISWGWVVQSIPRIVSIAASLVIGYLLLAKRERIIARIFDGGHVIVEEVDAAAARCPNCGASYDPDDYRGGVAEPLCANCKEPLDIART